LSHNLRKRLTNNISYTNNDPLATMDIIINNLSKILSKLEIDSTIQTKVLKHQSNILKKIQQRQLDIEKDFAILRLDLKATLLIPDDTYTRPAVDEIDRLPQFKNSKTLKKLVKNNPLD